MYARGVRRIFSVAAMVVALGACGADTASVSSATDAAAGAGSVPVASDSYDLVGGSTVDLAAVRAEKPIALWFWAPG